MNEDFNDYINSLLYSIRGSLQNYTGNPDAAFKYFSMAFLNENNSMLNEIEWKYVIENSFGTLCPLRYIHNCNINNKKLLLENFLTTLNSNQILENAWIQWANLIQNYSNKSGMKDMSTALAIMKCYIIALELSSYIKRNIYLARVCIK